MKLTPTEESDDSEKKYIEKQNRRANENAAERFEESRKKKDEYNSAIINNPSEFGIVNWIKKAYKWNLRLSKIGIFATLAASLYLLKRYYPKP